MARFFLLATLAGGLAVFMMFTKPSELGYLEKLQQRADAMATAPGQAFQQIRHSDPIDEMVAAQSPAELIAQTSVDDYFIANVFTTDYAAPGYGPRRVRVVAVLSFFVPYRIREY